MPSRGEPCLSRQAPARLHLEIGLPEITRGHPRSPETTRDLHAGHVSDRDMSETCPRHVHSLCSSPRTHPTPRRQRASPRTPPPAPCISLLKDTFATCLRHVCDMSATCLRHFSLACLQAARSSLPCCRRRCSPRRPTVVSRPSGCVRCSSKARLSHISPYLPHIPPISPPYLVEACLPPARRPPLPALLSSPARLVLPRPPSSRCCPRTPAPRAARQACFETRLASSSGSGSHRWRCPPASAAPTV